MRDLTWYEIDGERMGQGRDTAKMYLHENKDLFEKVKKEILNGEKTNRKINNNEKIDENGVISPNKD